MLPPPLGVVSAFVVRANVVFIQCDLPRAWPGALVLEVHLALDRFCDLDVTLLAAFV